MNSGDLFIKKVNFHKKAMKVANGVNWCKCLTVKVALNNNSGENMKRLFTIAFAVSALISAPVVMASPGGLDENGCHTSEKDGFHCHSKYKPDTEKQRLKKLHADTCGGVAGDNAKPRYDLYGKPCK